MLCIYCIALIAETSSEGFLWQRKKFLMFVCTCCKKYQINLHFGRYINKISRISCIVFKYNHLKNMEYFTLSKCLSVGFQMIFKFNASLKRKLCIWIIELNVKLWMQKFCNGNHSLLQLVPNFIIICHAF